MAELPVFMARIADGSVRVPVSAVPLTDVESAWQGDEPGRRTVLTA
ncbi:hypothetical protein [Microlunatus ginsengisoli]|uniref:Uncharacterized protein n=1 Tax=Microlunatus ginsengisoli TaxID=363863 RepID=A0ABP7AM45_9ACTN